MLKKHIFKSVPYNLLPMQTIGVTSSKVSNDVTKFKLKKKRAPRFGILFAALNDGGN